MPVKTSLSIAKRHTCTLNTLQLRRDLPRLPPYASACRKFFHNLRKQTIASGAHAKSSRYFRSSYTLYKEQHRHIINKKYRLIIHPLSWFAIVREGIMYFLWMTCFFLDPFCHSFAGPVITDHYSITRDIFVVCVNCALIIDVFVNFFLGYTIDRTKEIVLEPSRIAIHYLTTAFFFDLFPPTWRLLRFSHLHDIFTFPTYFLRFPRLFTSVRYFKNFLSFCHLPHALVMAITIATISLVLTHWLACFFYLLPAVGYKYFDMSFDDSWVLASTIGNRNRTITNVYAEFLMTVTCCFLGAGKGNVRTNNTMEYMTLSIALMLGLLVQVYVTAIVVVYFGAINISEGKFDEFWVQMNEYVKKKKLPQLMRKRIRMYYDYRYHNHYFDEKALEGSLSDHLRSEVMLHTCRNLIRKVRLFQTAPKHVTGTIISLLKRQIYLPDDLVLTDISTNENIYFIIFGTVTSCMPSGRELLHIEDGQHFGETYLLMKAVSDRFPIQLKAVEITEVYYLDKDSFRRLCALYPQVQETMENSAMAKFPMYRTLIDTAATETIDTSDILQELRKGRILDTGRRRF